MSAPPRPEAQDAPFLDPGDRPLRLRAETPEDLAVMAALTQDAVGKVADAAWLRRKRRFVAVLNRFRWEDATAADRGSRPYERVRAALTVENAMEVRARGVAPGARDQVFNLLDIGFAPGADGAGVLRLTLSGGAEIEIEVEALELSLGDLSRPWEAQAAPRHDD
ncbi:MAG: DUF2948 family protein [Rubrimonas sp.]|uniref:DUF2948 family protein n=1 Tax=Rubrimonas sp. TaxID=2036015 RepID=UPI002FDDA15A